MCDALFEKLRLQLTNDDWAALYRDSEADVQAVREHLPPLAAQLLLRSGFAVGDFSVKIA